MRVLFGRYKAVLFGGYGALGNGCYDLFIISVFSVGPLERLIIRKVAEIENFFGHELQMEV